MERTCVSFMTVSLSPVIILILTRQAGLSIEFVVVSFFLGGGGGGGEEDFQTSVSKNGEAKSYQKCNEVALFALEEDMIYSKSKTG